jgi:2-hydroxy-6-oxo-6-(2'-carboxyphenyl)-hexa-2,4-dienoate hydrolase
MLKKVNYAYLALILPLLFFAPAIVSADCTIDSDFIDRGETKAFVICGKDISSNYLLKGLSEANITVQYEQHLKMCAIGKAVPGLYLILKAGQNATTASLKILDAETKEPVCEGFTINVSEREHIAQATLQKPDGTGLPFSILEITGGETHDLRGACAEGLAFPEGKWPSLTLLSQREVEAIPSDVKARFAIDRSLTCNKTSIRTLVKVQGQQRYPAKIIVSNVKLESGEEKEGVAYVRLPPPEWQSSMKDEDAKYIDVNGIRTRYFDKGKGDGLLLIHGGQAGATSNAQVWQQNFDYLSKYFHVYAIDRLGQGYTDNPKTDKDYEEYYQRVVEHVYGFIKAVGIKKVHLVGQSQGGWPVTRIALDHPEIVKSVVNMDSGIAPEDPLARSMPFMMYIMFYVNPPEGATPESLHRSSEMWSYSMNNITDKKVQGSYRIMRLPKIIEARKQMIKYNMSPAHPSFKALRKQAHEEIKAGKLKVPSLVIWGYNDPSMHYQVGLELYKYMSAGTFDSQLHVFNNCGHSPYIEYPELFNRLIVNFCGQYASTPLK